MAVTWIVVAESSRARILEARSAKDPLTEVAALDHPEARMRELELVSDQPGSRHATRGPKRHGVSDPASMKEEHALKFARQVAERLESDRVENRYDRLILAAPPKFLGMLRGELAAGTNAVVVQEYHKNWLHEDPAKIREYLPEYL
jgi:protein required for attachment to host cells